ncbi:MAG: M56 family metallopeptidase [Defluviitaleaceae bacterium]|nr:M56 family metallopeptidase [Defluviitaleaceae bacterium]
MLVRIPLKKAPKVFSYVLWGVVLFRLICPFSIESIFSLMPASLNTIPQAIAYSRAPSIQTGIQFAGTPVNAAINNVPPPVISDISNPYSNVNINTNINAPASLGNSANPIHAFLQSAGYIWVIGFISLLIYAVIGYIRLKRHIYYATLIRDNVYETDSIKTPFVLGLINPKIYMPLGIEPSQYDYILKHEQTHIRRLDYLIKPFAFIVLALHWFNPFIWAAYILMSKDMEMSCDEAVLRKTDEDIRGGYSSSLLNLSVKRVSLITPLAFGESNVKSRVKNVLVFKKPAAWLSAVSFAVVIVLLVGFASNRASGFTAYGSGDLKQYEMPERISVHSGMTGLYRDITDDEVPLLVIEDNEGIELFYNLINNSQRLPGILNVTVSPYLAKIEYNSFVELIDLSLYFPVENRINGYGGMYISHSNSHTGYEFLTEDAEAFLNVYRTELYDVFMDYLVGLDSNRTNGIIPRTFYLEADDELKFTRLSSITLHNDNRARLAAPPISSFVLQHPYFYSFIDGELWFHYEQSDKPFARFEVVDENTLVFIEATVPLHADEGARYILSVNTEAWNDGTRHITLDDVRSIAQEINVSLTMDDLSEFIGKNIGSGLLLMEYFVENSDYILSVVSGGEDTVFRALLIHTAGGAASGSIDIRYHDVDKFIADGTIELIRPFPEPQETITASNDLTQLRTGRYISESGMSWVHLVDSRNFHFNRYSYYSFMPTGVYSVSDGKLTLRAGGNELYVFIIKNNGLELELESTYIEGILEQGMLFTFSRETG